MTTNTYVLTGESKKEWVDVAAVEDIAENRCVLADVDGIPVAVFNIDGEFLAIEDECSHEAYPLSDGTVEGDTIICAMHGAQFSLRTGEVLSAPASEPVATYAVRVANGKVQVQIDRSD